MGRLCFLHDLLQNRNKIMEIVQMDVAGEDFVFEINGQ